MEVTSARLLGETEGITAELVKLQHHGASGYIDEVLKLTRDCSLMMYAFKNFKYPDQSEGTDVVPVITKLLSWQQDLIKTCMCRALSASNELVSEAIFLFRLVTGYMKDRIVTIASGSGQGARKGGDGAQGEQSIALKIVEIMLLTPSKELYDELYCQIMKQITNNPSIDPMLQCNHGAKARGRGHTHILKQD